MAHSQQTRRGDRSEIAAWADKYVDSIDIAQEHHHEDPNVHRTVKQNILQAEMQLRVIGAALVTNFEAPSDAQQVQLQCVEEIAKSPLHPATDLCQELCSKVPLPSNSKKKKATPLTKQPVK